MATKTIEKVVLPPNPRYVGDGFRVHNFIPGTPGLTMQRMDPFILLDYNSKFYFPPSAEPRGVSVHPHKGFETVTIAYQGQVAHHDSSGNSGTISEGDVQWMTAGAGILHQEYHAEAFSRSGGDFQMVQLWVNLPSKDKLTAPKYQGLTLAEINKVALPDGQGQVEVIAGEYQGITGNATTFSPVHLLNAKLNEGGKASFSFPANYNTAILIIGGKVLVNAGTIVGTDHLAAFNHDGEIFEIEAKDGNAIVLILSGEPIGEPIVSQGPFVMNTQEELVEAYAEFRSGKFGRL